MYTKESQDNESVQLISGTPSVSEGTAGLKDIVPGQAASVSMAADATGGITAGNFIEPDVDKELFEFNSEDTPLMNLMLRAKRVNVNSPEVDHYMMDEAKSCVYTTGSAGGTTRAYTTLPLDEGDANALRPYTTLLVKDVDGYDVEGKTKTPGKDLMLFVTGHDTTTGFPVVRAVNGKKTTPEDEFGQIPAIPAGTRIVILANSLYETQKEVDPDLILPQPTRIYLQKRGMNQVVSDYFESQRKRMPFSQAVIAEQAIANFKVRGNRTLWAGRAGKFKVNVPKMGMQYVYTTEGLRWQFRKELEEPGTWTVDKIIAMAKMFFTGEDVPKSALLLAGKNLLESIQKIDYSRHPEINITTKQNSVGWTVTNFHTVFGDIEIKREPTLDRLGWSNSGALIGDNRLVHYVYSEQHSFEDRVEGEEATRNGLLIWDAIALKGTCHLWINGEGRDYESGSSIIKLWDQVTAPALDQTKDGNIYYLTVDCPGMSKTAQSGQLWKANISGSTLTWSRVKGEFN
ncbi:MAG: hypothetical protein J1F12_00935 [Muribaculaceae bacterium]|nr:hypothetical protein [Muribaculaceae bacterium]